MNRSILIAAGLLVLFSLVGVGLVAGTDTLTRESINANRQAYLLRSVTELVPPDQCDNDMFAATMDIVDAELLGSDEPTTIYRAFKNQRPVAAVFPVTAPDGYSGRIRLMVGIYYDGTLAGTRVLEHRETPGLGDKIDKQRSDWIFSFDNRSLANPEERHWKVQKDGGEFDQFTGATITPRAVVGAVYRALLFFDRERNTIFPPEAGSLQALQDEK